jgi:hypothetical protein
MLKEGIDYQIIDNSKIKDHASIKILKGEYEGVQYSYGKVKFELKEVDGVELPIMSFIYEIDKHPETLEKESLENDQYFTTYIGTILDKILIEQGQTDKHE